MEIEKIYVGGWFQRTLLHLAEIYDFMREASSPLELDPAKLKELHRALAIVELEFDVTRLDHIHLTTGEGIKAKIFEDGLILLSKDAAPPIQGDITRLTSYYEERLSPALSFLFSLGAPIPKELANIKTIYPYFIVLKRATAEDIGALLAQFQQVKHFEIKHETFEIYRGDKLYIINNLGEPLDALEDFIQEQIFIREFKSQLHRYLNLHRIIWERIAEVKERGEIRGRDISGLRTKIEGYNKTITLIDARIAQMGAYLNTRAAVARQNERLTHLTSTLAFKHETLADTLAYMKEIWKMTRGYVESALKLFADLQAKSTEASVKNLTIVTSVGVGATIIGLFTATKLPTFTTIGFLYFAILAAIGYSMNRCMQWVYGRRSYRIVEAKVEKDIR